MVEYVPTEGLKGRYTTFLDSIYVYKPVGIMIRPRAGIVRNCGSFPGRGKRRSSSSQYPYRLRRPKISYSTCIGGFFFGGKADGA
jgi:hypothetical protein